MELMYVWSLQYAKVKQMASNTEVGATAEWWGRENRQASQVVI
jgi:hypothetical protein